MRVIVANVGERDLYYNIGTETEPNFCHFEWNKPDATHLATKFGCAPGARNIAHEILKRLEKGENVLERCRYPILKTVLDAVPKPVDRLILVVTDQPESTAAEFRNRDTLYTGEILKKLVEKDYKSDVKQVSLGYYRFSPSRDQAYYYFKELLPKIAPLDTTTEFYASVSGGLPPLNDALLEQAIMLYRDKCELFEVIPPTEAECRKGKEKGEIKRVSQPFLRDLAITLVTQLLSRYDYSGALEILRTFKSVGAWKPEVEAMLRHAGSRMNLNFQEATRSVEPYKSTEPYKKWYEAVKKDDEVLRLMENYFVLEIRYNNHQYADMLPRIRLLYYLSKDLLPSPPQESDTWELLNSLQGLINLANDLLHQSKGIGIDSIDRCFKPPQKIVIGGTKRNHELLLPTLREIVRRIVKLKGREFIENPYCELNKHVIQALTESI